jgi:hypothetical protein
MPLPQKLTCALLLVAAAMPALAAIQVPTPRPPVIAARRATKTPHQEPCWQEAGISKSATQERRSLEQRARAEIQSVCGNDSLTPPERREQIRAIHERTRQQVEALMSPQQREALKACQQARNGGHVGGAGFHRRGAFHERGEGPCGELNEREAPTPERQP